jgi:hypothetical protein
LRCPKIFKISTTLGFQMNRRAIVLAAITAILLGGGIAFLMLRNPPVVASAVVAPPENAAAQARADAIAADLHRDDHRRYEPQAPVAIGDLPKAPAKNPNDG